MFNLLQEAAPWLSIWVLVLTVSEAIAGITALYSIKILIDVISAELSADQAPNLISVIEALIITGVALLVMAFLQSYSNILRMKQGFLVADYVDGQIHDRAIAVDLKYYESPAYYDALERARESGSQRPAQIVANLVITFRAVITLIGVFLLIGSIELLLLPALVLPVLIAFLIRLHFTRRLFDWRMSRAQRERRAQYFDWLMTTATHAKDLRLNRIGEYLRDQYGELRRDLRRDEIGIEQARLWSEFALAGLGALVFVSTSGWLLWQSLENSRPIGDVALFVMLLRRAELSGRDFVGNASKFVDDHLYVRRLLEFLSVKISIASSGAHLTIPSNLKTGIHFSNVTFRYDGASSDSLVDVSLSLPPGKIVAIVGANGSGKTTLIKLLTRLYDPRTGKITLDGIDIRKFDPEKYRSLLSVIFQDYSIYSDTVAENIRYGDVGLDGDRTNIEDAAKTAGAAPFIKELPNSYDTPLTKLFDDGHDLSIGQWQRIALARAFYPESKFVILDEPSSAMDPKAEVELFENFRSRLGGRGALIISHRLSTVRQADYTYVLNSGRISEQGTHEELVAAKKGYAELFERQAKYYR